MAKANNPEASLGKDKSSFEAASEGTRGGKSNGETATLRSGNLPKPEAARNAKPQDGMAVKCAERQNTSDGGDYSKKRNVIPNKSDQSLVVTAIAKVKE